MVVLILFVAGGCSSDLLDIKNTNNPDFEMVNATLDGASLESKAADLYRLYFVVNHHQNGMKPMMSTAADANTASHGNFGMWDASIEPRNVTWNNDPTYTNASHLNFMYANTYSTILSAVEIIAAIEGGVDAGVNGADNPRLLAFSNFMLGLSHMTLGHLYDKAFIVAPGAELEGTLDFTSPYQEVVEAAVDFLDEAISIATANPFVIPAAWMQTPADITSAEFIRIANTYAARTLSYAARNKTEDAQVDWNRVRSYADNGITSDLVIMLNASNWFVTGVSYLNIVAGWGQVDMRLANLMDPENQPAYWEDRPDFPHPPASTNPLDKRILTDFAWLSGNGFRPERGYYHFSNHRWSRLDASTFTLSWAGLGPWPEIYVAENDMLRAEARLHLGDVPGAADIINAGTRTTRGEMPPVAANATDVRQAIHHERMIELFMTGFGSEYYEMRKMDYLQKGTPLHFPIPAAALQTMSVEEPFYSFGGVANADGINTSNGGWR